MHVSILINNYNYAAYVGAAIDSALGQSWPHVDVVVVDDGSTDGSWDVIRGYGRRIEAVRTPNRGQGSAYNEGFLRARGDFVLFLDADDLLDADAIETCMAEARAGVAKVQFPLRMIDREARVIGGRVPYLLHDDARRPGSVLDTIRRFGHYAGPPASGNLYRREAIARYFPIEAERWPRAADTVPFLLAPFHGHVASIERPLGSYRLHRVAGGAGVWGNVNKSMRDLLMWEQTRRDTAIEWLERRSGMRVPGPFLPLPWSLRSRALSWRLTPDEHPWPDERRTRLMALQWRALAAWPGYGVGERALMLGWLAAVLALPRPLVERFASTNTSGRAKAAVRRLLRRAG